MEPFRVRRGESPVILTFPHVGTGLPETVAERLNDEGRLLRDTDWHIHELYAGLLPGVTTITATQSRYVIDLNRDPSGVSLYPGQTTTGLIPLDHLRQRGHLARGLRADRGRYRALVGPDPPPLPRRPCCRDRTGQGGARGCGSL